MQCQIFCTKRSYCDFVVWTKEEIYIERIYPIENFWLDKVARCKHIFVTAILPELFGKFYSRTLRAQSSTAREESSSETELQSTFCYCNGPEEGVMVGCDNDRCLYKWFHLECLSLKSAPKSKKWYYPDCRKQQEFKKKKA